MTSDVLRNWIAGLIVVVWTVIALATLFTKDYTALAAVTPVMMLVTSFLFGFRKEDKMIKLERKE